MTPNLTTSNVITLDIGGVTYAMCNGRLMSFDETEQHTLLNICHWLQLTTRNLGNMDAAWTHYLHRLTTEDATLDHETVLLGDIDEQHYADFFTSPELLAAAPALLNPITPSTHPSEN